MPLDLGDPISGLYYLVDFVWLFPPTTNILTKAMNMFLYQLMHSEFLLVSCMLLLKMTAHVVHKWLFNTMHVWTKELQMPKENTYKYIAMNLLNFMLGWQNVGSTDEFWGTALKNKLCACFHGALTAEETSHCLQHTVDMHSSSAASRCAWLVDDSLLEGLAKVTPSLMHLDISDCPHVTNAGLAVLLRLCKDVKDLCISGCLGVTSDIYAVFMASAKKLATIDISRCRHLGDVVVGSAATGCPALCNVDCSGTLETEVACLPCSLQCLCISGCTQIAVALLAAALAGLAALVSLVAQSTNVTDTCLRALGESLRRLEILDVSDCAAVTLDGLLPRIPPPTMKKPLSFSLVMYEQGDALGQLLALASIAHIGVLGAVAGAAYSRRDLHAAYVLLGACLCEAACTALKHAIEQPRPAGSDRADHGMPSSHAALWSYLAALALLSALRGRPRAALTLPMLRAAAACAGAGVVCAGRVYLGYHTAGQVAAGAVLGAALGVAWHAATAGGVVRRRVSPWIESLAVARALHVRDLSQIDGLEQAHYNATLRLRKSARSRQRKSTGHYNATLRLRKSARSRRAKPIGEIPVSSKFGNLDAREHDDEVREATCYLLEQECCMHSSEVSRMLLLEMVAHVVHKWLFSLMHVWTKELQTPEENTYKYITMNFLNLKIGWQNAGSTDEFWGTALKNMLCTCFHSALTAEEMSHCYALRHTVDIHVFFCHVEVKALGKSSFLFVLCLAAEWDGAKDTTPDGIPQDLADIATRVSIPTDPPLSKEQATRWTNELGWWPCVSKPLPRREAPPREPSPDEVARWESHMRDAVAAARAARASGSRRPVACVVVDPRTDTVVACSTDHTGEGVLRHACMECVAIVGAQQARQQDPQEYLCTGLDVIVTREPCVMCAMGLLHSRVRTVVYGCANESNGGLGSQYMIHEHKGLNHRFEVWRGVLRDECAALYSDPADPPAP
eukprot:m51a1_g9240 putative probable inactive trna-specific adenosine deaminase-like protein 3-like isoform x1 (963) ;mRNA; f:113237-121960